MKKGHVIKKIICILICAVFTMNVFAQVSFAEDTDVEGNTDISSEISGSSVELDAGEKGVDTDSRDGIFQEDSMSLAPETEDLEEHAGNTVADIMPMAESPEDVHAFTAEKTGELTHDIRTVTVNKSWRGDGQSSRPQSVTFELYQGGNVAPIDTVTMSADNATSADGNTWSVTFDGTYPIYDENGKEITYSVKEAVVNGYRSILNSHNSTIDTGYEDVSVYVPITQIEEGADYLVSSGNKDNVNLYRAEAYQTDGILKTDDGVVQAVQNGRNIQATDGQLYNAYILTADEFINGENATDYMTWRASLTNEGGAVLSSNCYRFWGKHESGDENKYPGVLSTKKNKLDGLCVDKNTYNSANDAPSEDVFLYDAESGGFRTNGSDKIVYLYKRITAVDGTFRTAKTTVSYTNWKNSAVSGDPMDPGDIIEPEDFTNITAAKVWEDGVENHVADSVTIVLYANGILQSEHVLNADNNWTYKSEGLPSKDSDGNIIQYTMSEKKAIGTDGKPLQYVAASDSEAISEKIWLPVDRPSKAAGGSDYLVVAFPTTKEEIKQDNIWDDGSGTNFAQRNALTSDSEGKKYALGNKNAGNVGGSAAMQLTVSGGPKVVNGTTYTSYVMDNQVKNTFIWNVAFVGTASADVADHADYGPFPRDLFTFQALSGKGGYLSTQGAMTLDASIKTDKFENNRNLFAYGMLTNDSWKYYNGMHDKDGFNDNQIAHMIGAMDHYGIRADSSPGGYNDRGKVFSGMYLYKGVLETKLNYTFTNKPIPKVNLNVNKWWDDNEDRNRPKSIRVELFKNGVSTNQYIDLKAENNWQGQFVDLYKTDTSGNVYIYTVKEYVENSDWYETTYVPVTDENGNIRVDITNRKTTIMQEFILQKLDGSTNKPLSGEFQFSLTNADGSEIEGLSNLTVDSNGQIRFSNLASGTYVLQETGHPNDYAGLPEPIRIIVSASAITLEGSSESYAEFVNQDGIYVLNIKNYKWISMPETGHKSAWLMYNIAFGLLSAGMLLIIILNYRKERNLKV